MYTVGVGELPLPEHTKHEVELISETLSFGFDAPHLRGTSFVGEVYYETDEPERFKVLGYQGLITSVVPEPASFNILVEEAWQQTAQCDCPGPDVDDIFEDFERAMEEAQISQDLDNFARTPTQDPHYETLPHLVGIEVTIRFDRLGAYGISGLMKS